MKKILIAVLAFLYLAMVSGLVVNVHYCMGKIASVKISDSADDPDDCPVCGMKDVPGCCHTDSKIVKLQDVHQSAKSFGEVKKVTPGIRTLPVSFNGTAQGRSLSIPVSVHAPPDIGPPVYILNRVFRI